MVLQKFESKLAFLEKNQKQLCIKKTKLLFKKNKQRQIITASKMLN